MGSKFKDTCNPTREEILRWAFTNESQPEQDFDLSVAREEFGDLVAELAANVSCPKQRFFVACLYLFVGDAVRSHFVAYSKEFISALIEKNEHSEAPIIQRWVKRSRALMAQPDNFNYERWCGWGYAVKEVPNPIATSNHEIVVDATELEKGFADTDRLINHFFVEPQEASLSPDGDQSILFISRRDLRLLSIPESHSPADGSLKSPFLAALVVMNGFEILISLREGKRELSYKARCVAFQKLLRLDVVESQLLVDFHDAVAHGYQLIAHPRRGKKTRFNLSDEVGLYKKIFERDATKTDKYTVNVWLLRKLFLSAIHETKTSLLNRDNIQGRNRFVMSFGYLQPYTSIF